MGILKIWIELRPQRRCAFDQHTFQHDVSILLDQAFLVGEHAQNSWVEHLVLVQHDVGVLFRDLLEVILILFSAVLHFFEQASVMILAQLIEGILSELGVSTQMTCGHLELAPHNAEVHTLVLVGEICCLLKRLRLLSRADWLQILTVLSVADFHHLLRDERMSRALVDGFVSVEHIWRKLPSENTCFSL